MSYDEGRKKSTMKYIRDKQQRICLCYKKDYYDKRIAPAITSSGLPKATFIKQAIEEKIERDRFLDKEKH